MGIVRFYHVEKPYQSIELGDPYLRTLRTDRIDKTEIPKPTDFIGKKTVIVMIGLPVLIEWSSINIGERKELYC